MQKKLQVIAKYHESKQNVSGHRKRASAVYQDDVSKVSAKRRGACVCEEERQVTVIIVLILILASDVDICILVCDFTLSKPTCQYTMASGNPHFIIACQKLQSNMVIKAENFF